MNRLNVKTVTALLICENVSCSLLVNSITTDGGKDFYSQMYLGPAVSPYVEGVSRCECENSSVSWSNTFIQTEISQHILRGLI